MYEECRHCSLICKRLDQGEEPVVYRFNRLTPQEVITMLEASIERFAIIYDFGMEEHERSEDNQLVVVLETRDMSHGSDNQIVLVAQASLNKETEETELWFLYGVPTECCGQSATLRCCAIVGEALEEIDWIDKILIGTREK